MAGAIAAAGLAAVTAMNALTEHATPIAERIPRTVAARIVEPSTTLTEPTTTTTTRPASVGGPSRPLGHRRRSADRVLQLVPAGVARVQRQLGRDVDDWTPVGSKVVVTR